MSAKKSSLGRNLNALLGVSPTVVATPKANETKGKFRNLPIEQLQRSPYQPRQDMDPEALQELSDSIKTQGIIQPIIVRPAENNRYEIIAGERRWRASQLAGLDEVPALIRELSDEDTMAMALIENIQREDLNPMEEARGIQRLISEFSLTHEQIAAAIGKPRATISNLLRLHSLQDDVKLMLEHGDVDMGHAKVLLALDGVEQSKAANIVASKNLSVRETEKLIKKLQEPNKIADVPSKIDPDIKNLQDNLSRKLGARVGFKHSDKGKGKLIIHYNSLDELDGILAHMS